jgi:hypothetical protein
MSHELVGFAGSGKTLLQFRERWRSCRLVYLRQVEFAFLPLPDDEAFDDAEATGEALPDEFFYESEFKAPQLHALAAYSRGSALAWVRTDYAGGAGYQAAILWVDGVHMFGPDMLWSKDDASRPSTEWPINRALRGIGVKRDGNTDEFAMFGLGGYRSYKDIIAAARDHIA